MKNYLLVLFAVIVGFSLSVHSQVAPKPASVIRQKLNQMISEYNKRFVNGKYVSNRKSIRSFNITQDAAAAEMKKSGNMRQVLFISNDYDENLSVKLFELIDENNKFVGLFYEKSFYFDEEERSFIRFSSMETVAKGLKFVPVSGTHAVIVKGHHFTTEAGGTLQINYLKDLKANSWGVVNLFLVNRADGWGLYNPTYQRISTAHVQTWSSILPPNGGVRDITIR